MQYLYHAFGSLHFATLHLFNQREQWWQGKTDTNRKGADGFSFCSSSLDRKTKSRHSRVTFVTQFKNCMDRKKLVLALVGWSRKDTATHQIINKELSKFVFNVTSFTMFTNHVIDFFTSARWLNYLHWALDVSFELAPLKHVAHPCQARLWHACDFWVFYDVIPNVDTCHFTDERLNGFKFSSLWVLLLP